MKSTVLFVFLLKLALVRCDIEPVFLVHGGADNIPEHQVKARLDGVRKAAFLGYKILRQGGSVIDAVEEAVRSMESDETFNAGVGSALNEDGEVEMDASIMVGSNLSSGAISVAKNVKHPISLARLVMERSPHFLLVGEGVRRFAQQQHVADAGPMVTAAAKADFKEVLAYPDRSYLVKRGAGACGAVAVDSKGRLAAATSGGGLIGRAVGRTSSTSIVGAAIYADDDVGAVATTGYGENIARYCLAHEIINQMKRGFDAGVATRNGVKGLTEKFRGPSGAITLSRTGQIGISFTSERMAWAYQTRDDLHYGIDDYEDFHEKIVNI